jgi:hypothetical protein
MIDNLLLRKSSDGVMKENVEEIENRNNVIAENMIT